MFKLRTYYPPDFSAEQFKKCPDAVLKEAPVDGVAPFDYHSMSIFPEYSNAGARGSSRRRAGWTAVPCTGKDPCRWSNSGI